MFNFFKKAKDKGILAPQNGKAIPLKEVPDEVFSQKMLGDGIAIIPEDGKVVSPVDGTIAQITDTLHAYGIKSDDGLDILIHCGIDTVSMNGEGFDVKVKEGQKVKVGDLIANVNIKLIKERGFSLHTPLIITNFDEIKDFEPVIGDVKSGETVVIKYKK